MAQIRHIAIATQDADKTARFYVDVMGLKEVGRVSSPNATGYYLSDGHINLAILTFTNPQAAGAEYGTEYSGLHHFGFEVEDMEETTRKLAEAGIGPREDINSAFHLSSAAPRKMNVEVKYAAPDGVILDISETGWVGTHAVEAPIAVER